MAFKFDFSELWDIFMATLLRIIKFPFQQWANSPVYFKWIIYVSIIMLGLLIVGLVIRYRNEWRSRFY